MEIRALTHVGLVREINEDYYAIVSHDETGAMAIVIADGMGGHQSGEVASRIAVDEFCNFFKENFRCQNEDELKEFLKAGITRSNERVYAESLLSSEKNGMGTTFTAALIFDCHLYVGHVGDSRIYLYREADMRKITEDHSYIEELLRRGAISHEEAENHPQKNLITRALGCQTSVEPDVYIENLNRNDLLLLCTDGLTNMVPEESMMELLNKNPEPGDLCEQLVQIANSNGGTDNITVIALRIE